MSKKRKLYDAPKPPTKRFKQEPRGLDACMPHENDTITVKFPDGEALLSRQKLMRIKFCEVKLKRWSHTNHTENDNHDYIEPNKENNAPIRKEVRFVWYVVRSQEFGEYLPATRLIRKIFG
eukprot:755745_1